MQQYLLFVWAALECQGGWHDIQGVYLTEREALDALTPAVIDYFGGDKCCAQVVCLGNTPRTRNGLVTAVFYDGQWR